MYTIYYTYILYIYIYIYIIYIYIYMVNFVFSATKKCPRKVFFSHLYSTWSATLRTVEIVFGSLLGVISPGHDPRSGSRHR
jgi:hypothetical protein